MNTMTQISKEYAAALFSLALEQKAAARWAQQLEVMEKALEATPDYISLLASPEIPGEERAGLLSKAFAGQADPELLSFAGLMCRKGRARELPDAIRRFRQLADEAAKRSRATVTSAVALTENEKNKLRASLEKQRGGTVELTCRVDPSLLGGMIVEMEGRIVDGSLRSRLQEIKEVIGG